MKITFRDDLQVEETMAFEALFHEELALDADDKFDILEECSIKVWMFVDGVLAGETYAMDAANVTEDLGDGPGGLDDVKPYFKKPALYVYSIAVLPQFQGKGLAKILKAYFLGLVWGKGYDFVVDHAYEGQSIKLNESFGAKVIAKHDNWYDTGKPSYFNEIARPGL